jgi:tRNA(Arg) A34 adenosine deaminase TadA
MSSATYDPKFMNRAIDLSITGHRSGKGLPIGCVIVKDGGIIGEGHNEIFVRNNPTAHAEMVAIEDACGKSNNILLDGCELYTSMQPCPMCFGAIYWAGIKTVYYATSAEEAAAAGFDDAFIYHQLSKPPAQQLIPMHYIKTDDALRVLMDWKQNNYSPIAGRHSTSAAEEQPDL